ncbi:SGNH hydrolase domain-containing protein [Nocardioides sp.]|uniref:SGNH hydrolase domain-containing protein n=1 Tax=Nocardioides sp. TaxID=35761 RepID=UPI003512A68F
MGGRSSLPRRIAWVSGLLGLVLVFAVTVVAVVTARGDADQAPTPTAAPTPAALPASCVDGDDLVPDTARRCDLLPYVPGRPTLVLWGDSHAWHLVPALTEAIGAQPVNLVGFLFGSCPLVRIEARTECARTNDLALRFVRQAVRRGDDVRVVASEAWELYRDALPGSTGEEPLPTSDAIIKAAPETVDGTPRLFRTLATLGVPTDVVGPMPVVPTDVTGCTALQPGTPSECELPRAAALEDEDDTRREIERLMTGLDDATLIDPSPALCDDATCAAVLDGMPVFLDNIHLSAESSRLLADYFSPTVERLLADA